MDAVLILAIVVLVVVMWVSAASAVVSAVRLPEYAWRAAGRSKQGTILGIIVSGGLGGLYYWLSIHRLVKDARQSNVPPRKSDPRSKDGW
jgi:hypothetical protein